MWIQRVWSVMNSNISSKICWLLFFSPYLFLLSNTYLLHSSSLTPPVSAPLPLLFVGRRPAALARSPRISSSAWVAPSPASWASWPWHRLGEGSAKRSSFLSRCKEARVWFWGFLRWFFHWTKNQESKAKPGEESEALKKEIHRNLSLKKSFWNSAPKSLFFGLSKGQPRVDADSQWAFIDLKQLWPWPMYHLHIILYRTISNL